MAVLSGVRHRIEVKVGAASSRGVLRLRVGPRHAQRVECICLVWFATLRRVPNREKVEVVVLGCRAAIKLVLSPVNML